MTFLNKYWKIYHFAGDVKLSREVWNQDDYLALHEDLTQLQSYADNHVLAFTTSK